ncbi:MAG: hypothetical protein DMG46_27110 [Acidobacteria bacterium]|nr:MAG: hypothetical protein DMG46_27110 [Acidobacteriota bacterium]
MLGETGRDFRLRRRQDTAVEYPTVLSCSKKLQMAISRSGRAIRFGVPTLRLTSQATATEIFWFLDKALPISSWQRLFQCPAGTLAR